MNRPNQIALRGRLVAEFVGTALLLAAVVGSGIMAESLTNDVGLQLFQNAFATAGVLVALIVAFAGVSGAHFNPAVTLAERLFGTIDNRTALTYVAVQVPGAITGVVAANLMFALPVIEWSTKDRSASNLIFAEAIATFGLVLIIAAAVRTGRATLVPFAVAGYIGGAYYFTSSTSFANPAVTIARTMSDTFAGIAPAAAPAFIVAQLVGTLAAVGATRLMFAGASAGTDETTAERVGADGQAED